MDKRDKEILIETLEYFLNGLKDVEAATQEQQPKIYELEYLIPLVRNLTIPVVIKSGCWKCKEPIKYNENGLPNYRCECGAVEPQTVL